MSDYHCLFEVMSSGEAAKLLAVSPRQVRRWCERGELVSRLSGGTWLISSVSVQIKLDQLQKEQQNAGD